MGDKIDTSVHEPSYIAGKNAALRRSIVAMAHELSVFAPEDPAAKVAYLLDERACVQRALREMFELLGCDDWSDDLHLGDVVEKNLLPALKQKLDVLGRR